MARKNKTVRKPLKTKRKSKRKPVKSRKSKHVRKQIKSKKIKDIQEGGFEPITTVTLMAVIPFIKSIILPELIGLIMGEIKHMSDDKCVNYSNSVKGNYLTSGNDIKSCRQLSQKAVKEITFRASKGGKEWLKLFLQNLKQEFKVSHLKNPRDIKYFLKSILRVGSGFTILKVIFMTTTHTLDKFKDDKLGSQVARDIETQITKSPLKGMYQKFKDKTKGLYHINKDTLLKYQSVSEAHAAMMKKHNL
jgi:hypothetical protein